MLNLPRLDATPFETWKQVQSKLTSAPFYRLIERHYEGKTAKRSGLPYINHIHEGVYILHRLFGWNEGTIAAFCVHPIFQSDSALQKALHGDIDIRFLDPEVILLAMEYRKVANAYISTMKIREPEAIKLSPLEEVNRMLIADKVQNKKDFMSHMYKQVDRPSYHKVSQRYLDYFDSWLVRLDIPQELYQQLVSELSTVFGGDLLSNGAGD